MHTTVHIQNRVMLRNNNNKNPYELWKGSIDNNLYIKITQNMSKKTRNFISQTKYIREMLKRFGMKDCKLVTTPMQTSCKLSKDDSKSTDHMQYRSMIGSLLYVTTSRLDVMQEIG